LIGLAVMGQNLILNMNDHGFTVVAYNRTVEKVDEFLAKEAKGTKVLEGPELRTIFLGFDQHRDELLDMKGSGKNPFKDKRVREAFYKVIDIQSIARVVMRGESRPTGSMVAPGIAGFSEDVDKRPAFNPDEAKKLLAAAGYPNGFSVTLDCPNDRYTNDEAICQAVVGMLGQIGVPEAIAGIADNIAKDFARWEDFHKIPRVPAHSTRGVIELMPVSDAAMYSCKYVNGHPGNNADGLPTVMAFGFLCEMETGRPLLMSELTLTTALRTAAMSAFAASVLGSSG